MVIAYNVYGNNGSGPIDYSTVLATVSGTTWQSPALAPGSSWQFAVRATDTASGLTESNVDARVAVNVDGSGADLGALPPTPTIEGAIVFGSNSCRLDWSCVRPIGQAAPTAFAVFVAPGTINPAATPTMVVAKPITDRSPLTGCVLTGMPTGSSTVGVAAMRGTTLGPVATILVSVASGPPAAVDQFTIGTTDRPSV